MIRFNCTCKHPFESEDNMAGGLVQCPKCGRLNDIPTLSDLQSIEDDGTYRMDAETEETAANRLGELRRAFARNRVDEYGAEIDLRPTMQDIRDAGASEVPLELKDEIRPGAPKYDPVTGELIRPMDIRQTTPADGAVPAMPVRNRTLKYASRDLNMVTNGFEIIAQMIALPNLIVMMVIFVSHLLLQVVTYAMLFVILLFPVYLFLVGLLIAHYANTIDETGPEARDELPRPLRNVSWHEDMWGPFFQVMLAFGVAYAPGLACLLLKVPLEIRVSLAITLGLIGTFAFPAILLTTTTSGTVLNLRPDRLFGVMRECGAIAYGIMLIGWLASIGVYLFALVGTMAASDTLFGGSPGTGIRQVLFHWAVQYPLLFAGIFMMHAYGWYLGLQYRKHHADFPWVLQRYTGQRGKGAAAAAPRQGFAVLSKTEPPASARARQPQAALPPRVAPRAVQVLPQPPEPDNRA